MFAIVLTYAVNKAVQLFKLEKYEIKTRTMFQHFNYTHTFGDEQNITFAFGMYETDKRCGSIKAYYENFDVKGLPFDIYPIKIRPCTTDDDINIPNDAQYDQMDYSGEGDWDWDDLDWLWPEDDSQTD